MRLVKRINSFAENKLQSSFLKTVTNQKKFLALIIFVILYFLFHLPYLGSNELNPDAVNWHHRSEQFVLAFKIKDFAKTYQHYHPGVTLMWIVGPTVELVKQFTIAGDGYNSLNFEFFHFAAKFSLLLVNLVLTILMIYFGTKITGFKISMLTAILLNLEPFFLGNSRVLHMDVLFTNLAVVALSATFFAFRSQRFLVFMSAGAFTALAILTRSIGVGLLLYNFVFMLYTGIVTKSKRRTLYIPVFLLVFAITCFVLFPAMWVRPIRTIDRVFTRSYQVGVEDGHEQIFLGEFTTDPGAVFYLYVALIKMSPFMLMGVALGFIFGAVLFVRIIKNKQFTTLVKETLLFKNALSYVLFLIVFYVGYFYVLNTSAKKLDRYILPTYYIISLVSVYGFYYLAKFFNYKVVKSLIVIFFIYGVLYPIYKFSPFEFLYYSPLVKNSATADSYILQKNFGMGVLPFRNFIVERYGCMNEMPKYPKNFKVVLYNGSYQCPAVPGFPNIGIRDAKAMIKVYGNSNTTDFRYNSASTYDLFVLVATDDVPDDVREKNIKFKKDASVYVNDIELWRVYVRDN